VSIFRAFPFVKLVDTTKYVQIYLSLQESADLAKQRSGMQLNYFEISFRSMYIE